MSLFLLYIWLSGESAGNKWSAGQGEAGEPVCIQPDKVGPDATLKVFVPICDKEKETM